MKVNKLFKDRQAGIDHINNCSVRNTPERILVFDRIITLSTMFPVFQMKDIVLICDKVLSAATVYNCVAFFKKIGIVSEETSELPLSKKSLAQIIEENATQSEILTKNADKVFAFVKVKSIGKLYSLDEIEKLAPLMGDDVAIIKVYRLLTQPQKSKYGIVWDKSSKIYGKKVKLGVMNEDGIIRCTPINSKQFDYIHKSFIKML